MSAQQFDQEFNFIRNTWIVCPAKLADMKIAKAEAITFVAQGINQ